MPQPPNLIDLLDHRAPEHENAVATAMAWLIERHRKGWTNAVTATLAEFDPGAALDLAALDDGEMHSVMINVGEWLLARGQIHARGGLRPINPYLIGPSGAPLTAAQARWIAQLGERPLRLYRVTDVRAGEGLTLVDALDEDGAPLQVRERSGSRNARPGMLLGARLMHAAGLVELSGAIYAFAALREPALLDALRDVPAEQGTTAQTQADYELTLARHWLAQFSGPPPMPELRDASGDALLLVTDHYRVHDAAALAAALAAQPEVRGDASAGWSRTQDAGDGLVRSLLAINPGKSADRIEVFAHTQRLADDGRTWFEAVAGAAVQHLTREITDPRSPQALAAAGKRPAPPLDIDPQQLGELIGQALRRSYANWADEPIPALGGRTPRQAIATPGGLERVKGLLRQYEAGEAEQARQQKRSEVSFQFLWDALGLTR